MLRHALDVTTTSAPASDGPRQAALPMVHAGYETVSLNDLAAVEAARQTGLLADWEQLLAADEAATFFQMPAWCLTWYRCYAQDFQPLVLMVTCAGRLAGLVTLAVERATGRLTFAGDNMSDYRDVLAAAEHRAAVVAALLRCYRAGAFPNVLRLGPLQPTSPTAQLAPQQARAVGLCTIARAHECWRLWFGDAASLQRLTGKESVRRRLNYYRRQGELTLERIETTEDWARLRETFCAHHSLRQLQTARPVSFNDPRKRAFYDALIAEHPDVVHLTALRVGARYIAEHYGYVCRDVLYWGAPAHDIAEEKNSPGQLLLALLIQTAATEGLVGIDFTLGTEEFKQRFGNERVELPTIEVYPSARRYHLRRARDAAAKSVKRLAQKLDNTRALHTLTRSEWPRTISAHGLRPAVRALARRAFGRRTSDVRYVATPVTIVAAAPQLIAGATCTFRQNELSDLARWPNCAPETLAALTRAVRSAPEALRRGAALHTVLIDERLAGWVWAQGRQTAQAENATTAPDASAQIITLADCYVLPEWRGRNIGAALLAHVLQMEFAAGRSRVEIICPATDARAQKVVERAGFRPGARAA
jgi:CelD/BcsL family acetyltransferase involved in cellulose biosynthesis/ribosomal protein S18 acetylase RimI-like enzyme